MLCMELMGSEDQESREAISMTISINDDKGSNTSAQLKSFTLLCLQELCICSPAHLECILPPTQGMLTKIIIQGTKDNQENKVTKWHNSGQIKQMKRREY